MLKTQKQFLMKLPTQWQNIFTETFLQKQPSSFVILTAALFLFAGCAAKTGTSSGGAAIPVASAEDQQEGSLETLNQGLAYIREHPAQSEDEQVQRYLWLDQWAKVLQDKQRLTPTMSRQFWGDFTNFVAEPPTSSRGLDRLLARTQTQIGTNVAAFALYQRLLQDDSIEKAVGQLEKIQEDGVSDLYTKAQEILGINKSRSEGGSRKIGVLLPLTGDFRPFGLAALQALQLVSERALSEGVEYIVEDAGTTEGQLAHAWGRLVGEEKVVAVLGPLTNKESEWAFERAEVVGVPVISLAQKENIKTFGRYSVRSVLRLQDQVEKVASFIRGTMGSKRVAVLMPDSTYGWDVMNWAEKEFKDKDIRIQHVELYPQGATDFKNELKRMVRLDFPKLRKDEICAAGGPPDAADVTKCVKKPGDLRPILDFEVLFVPDYADTVGLLMPTLPFLGIYGVQVVGLSGLNSPNFVQRGGDVTEGVVFTDSYLPTSEDTATRYFIETFKQRFGAEPSRMAAEFFDIAMVSLDILTRSDSSVSGGVFLDRLKSIQEFPGAAGSLSFEDGNLQRNPKLMIVRDRKFRDFVAKAR